MRPDFSRTLKPGFEVMSREDRRQNSCLEEVSTSKGIATRVLGLLITYYFLLFLLFLILNLKMVLNQIIILRKKYFYLYFIPTFDIVELATHKGIVGDLLLYRLSCKKV